ncbi:hypothetical protein BC939DRAFT_313177 [Gamsiella multidivaricata]|uniref:uncharacterized protein n=1 Tax=Gamsiella multidivaricata TaxID=101098 RepID=UPI002220B32E|nr:uncharacterized protein BC939DRAFT_313177 [Gamsiella multidivaricata]KAG0352406.1 hypothetical protein BGZ54_002812 [Gamsiella multidivaricata]KAI7817874.1 hypothetical protein BC939DRAFT_313177 [Gamsiella multidivaricata]
MTSERPSIPPIATMAPTAANPREAHLTVSCPNIGTKSTPMNSSTIPGLPSPPLSPFSNTTAGHDSRSDSLPLMPMPLACAQPAILRVVEDDDAFTGSLDRLSSLETLSDQLHQLSSPRSSEEIIGVQQPVRRSADHQENHILAAQLTSIPSVRTNSNSNSTAAEGGFADGSPMAVEIEELVPMLPSQLRKRHESMRIPARTAQTQPPVISALESTNQASVSTPMIQLDLVRNPRDHNSQSRGISDNKDDEEDDESDTDSVLASYHSGTMIRAKSYSMFESNNLGSSADSSIMLTPSQRMRIIQGLMPSSAISPSSIPMDHHSEMSAREWIQMQSKMQALELEVSHVKRTNTLLNQELDKVNANLRRLAALASGDEDGGEGWRREYEFLVQQVDWMHRQLQQAQAEQYAERMRLDVSEMALTGAGATPSRYQTEMTRELCTEVKDLTTSLRMWQSAFQQAEEKYRRKCDGERALKKTLQEREAQLSSLVEKLSGYEGEFQKSIANYEELMRLSAELELLQGPSTTEDQQEARDFASSSSKGRVVSNDKSNMPGTFPGQLWGRSSVTEDSSAITTTTTTTTTTTDTLTVDQLSVSILSWAALLATYMLS